MIKFTNVEKFYVGEYLLRDVNWQMAPGEKIGLIGANGTGKTTQLRMITGSETPDAGEVSIAPGITMGYLSQEPIVDAENTLDKELHLVFKDVLDVETKIKALQHEIATIKEEQLLETKLKEIATLQEYFDHKEGYAIDAKIGQVIAGLGFNETDRSKLIKTFSGGWQMRISIAKLLLEAPDLLLLDEPTNHLDIKAIEWLESYLSTYKGGYIIVSHDRSFLDNTVNRILAMEGPYVKLYWGNYSHCLEEQDRIYEAQLEAYTLQQKKLAKDKQFIDRFRASANRSSQAKSRERQLSKIDIIDPPKKAKKVRFSFPPGIKSGEEVLKLKSISKAFGENEIFNDLSVEIQAGDKIGLIGDNGTGKTTLLRIILGLDREYKGKVSPGHLVKMAYFNQNQARSLAGTQTAFEELHNAAPTYTNEQVRTTLGCFGITGENVFKQLDDLSGGEKARIALSKMLMSGANVLIFDEPTNHLDIPAKEALEQALNDFDDTIIVVSHDRKFIDNVTTKIFAIENKSISVYPGNYTYYKFKKAEQEKKAASVATSISDEKKPEKKQCDKKPVEEILNTKKITPKAVQKQLEKTEKLIMSIEKEISDLETVLADPSLYQSDPDKFMKTNDRLQSLKKELETLNCEWEQLIDLAETME